jgi:hypothetical protein
MLNQNKGGRPSKFSVPSRAITVTLPVSALEQLQRLDPDRSSAIVRMVNEAQSRNMGRELVDVVPVGPSHGLIITVFSSAFLKIPFARLVEIEPGRHLIALDSSHNFTDLEIAVTDLLADPKDISSQDFTLMLTLLTTLRRLRKADQVSRAEILLVDLEF